MATDVRTIHVSARDDATQRAWVASFIAALTACGLVRTNDTGQFDITATNRNVQNGTVENVYQGYLMFRFSDALQSTAPVFIRFNLYVCFHGDQYYNFGNPGQPAIYMQVGRATDGAGNFVGVATNNLRIVSEHSPASVYNPNYSFNAGASYNNCAVWTCGSGSAIQCVMGAQNTQQMYYAQNNGSLNSYGAWPGFFWVERTRNADGSPNGDGCIVATSGWPEFGLTLPTSSQPAVQTLSFLNTNQVTAQESVWPITWPGGNAFSIASQGADLYVLPAQLASPKAAYALGFMGFYKGDTTLGSQFSVSYLGATHTFISLAGITGNGNAENNRSWINNFVTNGALLMRWE